MKWHTLEDVPHAPAYKPSLILGLGRDVVFVVFCLLGSPSEIVRLRALTLLLKVIRPRVIELVGAYVLDAQFQGPPREQIVQQALWAVQDELARGACRARSIQDLATAIDRVVQDFLDDADAWREMAPCTAPRRLPDLDALLILPRPYRHALLRSVGERLDEGAFDLLMRAQSPTTSPVVRRLALRDELLQARLTEARAAFSGAVLDAVQRELALLMDRDPLRWAA